MRSIKIGIPIWFDELDDKEIIKEIISMDFKIIRFEKNGFEGILLNVMK